MSLRSKNNLKLFSKTKRMIMISCLTVMTSNSFADIDTTKTGIPLDTDWKKKVYNFALDNVKHSAWGVAHSERDYQISVVIADKEGIKIDRDILFAAVFLHDIGAIDPFRKKDVEHSIRSIEIAEPLLQSYGFPMAKWPKVKATILGHMYYAEKPIDAEAIVMHDADILDFLGSVGIMRIISITERHIWAENLAGTFETLHKFKNELPNKLITDAAKNMANGRLLEINQFLCSLDPEIFNGKAL